MLPPTCSFLLAPLQNSWIATRMRKRGGKRNEIMHDLAGVGQAEENSRGKTRKKKKICTLVRNAKNCSALQWLCDLLENKILASTLLLRPKSSIYINEVCSRTDSLCCSQRLKVQSCCCTHVCPGPYSALIMIVCVLVCSCSGLTLFFSSRRLALSTYSKSPTVSLVSGACRLRLQPDGST